jgi:hypothetical protein
MDGAWRFMSGELGYSCFYLDSASARLELLTQPGDKENLLFCPPETMSRFLDSRGGVDLADIEA